MASEKIKTPPSLQTGDKVAIVCPAGHIKKDIGQAFDMIESWGLVPVVGSTVYAQENQYAGTDAHRAQDLQQALDDREIKAIIAGRGGYGTVRIIDKLDFTQFAQNPKWIVGYSDITVLLSHIQNQYGVAAIHGQMAKTLLDGSAESIETLKNALFGQNVDIQYSYADFPNRSGQATGILTGGNLALLQSILHSASDVDYTDKILFIEDVGEKLYNIDRMLWSLKRAGKLDHIKGLIVGGFTELSDSPPPFGQSFEEIILDKVREYNFPIAFGCPAGHIDDNRALVFGKHITLEVDKANISITYND